jgi:hypothetical protein
MILKEGNFLFKKLSRKAINFKTRGFAFHKQIPAYTVKITLHTGPCRN